MHNLDKSEPQVEKGMRIFKPKSHAQEENHIGSSHFDSSKLGVFCKTSKNTSNEPLFIDSKPKTQQNHPEILDTKNNSIQNKQQGISKPQLPAQGKSSSFHKKMQMIVQKQRSSLLESIPEKKNDVSPLNSILSMTLPTNVKKNLTYNKSCLMAPSRQRPTIHQEDQISGSSLHLQKSEGHTSKNHNQTCIFDSSASSQDVLNSLSLQRNASITSNDFDRQLLTHSYISTTSTTQDNSLALSNGHKSCYPSYEFEQKYDPARSFDARHMSFQGVYPQSDYQNYCYYQTNQIFDFSPELSANTSFHDGYLENGFSGHYNQMMYINYDQNAGRKPEKSAGRRKCKIDQDSTLFNVNVSEVSTSGKTTLMIKNIPNKYTQVMMIQMIDKKFKDTYDFFYLPIDFANKCNVGYAFINFKSPKYVEEFYFEMHKKKWDKFSSQKICEIKYARIQGKEGLIKHFENSRIMSQQDKKIKPNFILGDKSQ